MTSTLALSLACAPPHDPASGLPDPSGEVVLTDANNYDFRGDLDGPTVPLAEYADASLAWSGLVEDLQCHELDPVEDIDTAALMIFPLLSEEEVEVGLALDTLRQVDLGAYLEFQPGSSTTATLSDFTFFGTEADIWQDFDEGSGTWLVTLNTGVQVGAGSRMFVFLEPSPVSEDTHVEIAEGCGVLDSEADLEALRPAPVLEEGPWEVDWSAVTTNGSGVPFQANRVDEVSLARFDEEVSVLEQDFLDLEFLAAEHYRLEHPGGYSADLADLVDEQGRSFGGFGADGTWLLALRCGTCSNPAPLFLTALKVGGRPHE